jgi:nitroimidazol reductase NimA-like FMN-containing flavoprotein (pyridoxamine 5'-phosphate oxidase superfamily)
VSQHPEDARRLFEGPNYAHLATLLPDGGPHNVPLWAGMEGNRIALLTSPSSRQARNLDRDPHVALSDHRPPLTEVSRTAPIRCAPIGSSS